MRAVRIVMRHRSMYEAGVSVSRSTFRRHLPVSPTVSWTVATSSRSDSGRYVWVRAVCSYRNHTYLMYPYSTSRKVRYWPESCAASH